MAERTFAVMVNGNTPTLFVTAEGAKQISIERANGGLVKISLEEAPKLRETLIHAEIYLQLVGSREKK
jgi:hypothetical protein